jgi:hypothetical protein
MQPYQHLGHSRDQGHSTTTIRRLPSRLLRPHIGTSPHVTPPSALSATTPFTHTILQHAAHARTLPSTPTAAHLKDPTRSNAHGAVKASGTTLLANTRSSGLPAFNSTTLIVRPPPAPLHSPSSILVLYHSLLPYYPTPALHHGRTPSSPSIGSGSG